ncbi:MAG TPA: hypothetical protein VFU02_23090 [Polyangiaceae bacterium]|nr:hypothetical protein [Polyangiaceae bacterium]
MNLEILIGSIVRQTTVLIAQLATSGGARAPLAHIANQVFSDLARELERQGLSRVVAADLFGISLRSYQRKMIRLRESSSDRGRSMWDAVLQYLVARGVTTRAEVLERFNRDPEPIVRGLLSDLVQSGFVFSSGSGAHTLYRATSEDELTAVRQSQAVRGLDEFVWAVVYRHGPLDRERLSELVAVDAEQLVLVLDRLCQNGRVTSSTDAGITRYSSHGLFLEQGASVGWEASIYDHFLALVRTICSRLEDAPEAREYAPYTGGSTYSFDVGPEHPLREEVLSTLAQFRERASDLRQRVMAYNETHGQPETVERVVAYAGQSVIRQFDEALERERPDKENGERDEND